MRPGWGRSQPNDLRQVNFEEVVEVAEVVELEVEVEVVPGTWQVKVKVMEVRVLHNVLILVSCAILTTTDPAQVDDNDVDDGEDVDGDDDFAQLMQREHK